MRIRNDYKYYSSHQYTLMRPSHQTEALKWKLNTGDAHSIKTTCRLILLVQGFDMCDHLCSPVT